MFSTERSLKGLYAREETGFEQNLALETFVKFFFWGSSYIKVVECKFMKV